MSSDPISRYDSHGFNFCTRRNNSYDFISPLRPPNLEGRYILVTGAAGVIGKAIAISLARAGAAGIVVTDLSESALEAVAAQLLQEAEQLGHRAPQIVSHAANITQADQVTALGGVVDRAFGGRLDALILNAGVLEPVVTIVHQDPKDWWRSYEVFVLGTFHCLQTFLPMLGRKSDGLGTVLAVNSQASTLLRVGMSGMASAKLAQHKLLDFVNAECGKGEEGTSVIAYCVHPGGIAHPDRKDLPGELRTIQIDKPELPGDTIAWLIKERREWLAGRFISCNWE
jgi:NAD(P)-dependent dehydrogenase (short-subunit alcohol dehydrogenase family)